MIFLLHFGKSKHSQIFKDYKCTYVLVQFFVVFEKFACAYLFQSVLEIIYK